MFEPVSLPMRGTKARSFDWLSRGQRISIGEENGLCKGGFTRGLGKGGGVVPVGSEGDRVEMPVQVLLTNFGQSAVQGEELVWVESFQLPRLEHLLPLQKAL